MQAQFNCKRCQTLLTIPVAKLGKKTLCPVCQHVVTVMRESDVLEPEEAVISPSGSSGYSSQAVDRQLPVSKRPSGPPRVRPREEPSTEGRMVGCGPIIAVGLIFLALITVLMVGNLAWFQRRPIEWAQVDGDGFSVKMPRNHRALRAGNGFVATRRRVFYRVEYEEVPPGVLKLGAAKLFNLQREELRKGPRPLNLVKEQGLQLGKHPGREIVLNSLRVNLVARLYLVEDRLYLLEARGFRVRPDSPNVEKFFDSFELEK